MATIKDEAKAYEPPQTKNIADLPAVSVDLALEDGEGSDAEGKTFKYKCLVLNGEEYRVPGKVLGDLRVLLENMPGLEKFRVIRKGEGLKTKYTVIPITEPID